MSTCFFVHMFFVEEIIESPIRVLPLCSQSAQPFQPLAMRAEAWQAIPGVSAWVMTTVRRGYTLQFARRPHMPRGLVHVAGSERRVQATTIQHHGALFKEGTARPLKAFQKMLGLMAAASPVLQLGLPHIQF